MKRSHLLGTVFACAAALISASPNAEILVYDFTGTVTDAGNIAGVSASLGETIIGEFAYDTSTLDSNPGDATSGEYRHPGITPSLKITLPSGSITFDSFTSVFVTVATGINITAGVPDPTVPGNNIDHDIKFSRKPTSTALATDALPTNINLNDFDPATGAFSSFSLENGPTGDPVFYTIDSLAVRAPPSSPPKATFLAPRWIAADFMTLETPTRAIAFDSDSNLYIEDTSDDNSGKIDVLKLTFASGYNDSSSYARYATSYKGATGLGFDDLGSLYVAERSADGNAGVIREVNAVTQTLGRDVKAFANHRPTGVDADTSGNIFYSGRKESAGAWGRIFGIDTNTKRTILIDNTVATGVAVNPSGNIFISTPQRTDLPLQSNSIYMYKPEDIQNPRLIATFNNRGGELTFDAAGNLYMVFHDKLNIIKLSRIRAMPWLPLLLE